MQLRLKKLFLFGLVGLLTTACAGGIPEIENAGPSSSPEMCAASNGDWISFTELYPDEDLNEEDQRRFVCNLRTLDAGMACTGSRQCKGQCIAPDLAESGQQVTGKCSTHARLISGTLTVEYGRVTYPMFTMQMTERKETMLRRMEAARSQWVALGIQNYDISVADETCFCLYGPYIGPNRVVVRNGEIFLVMYQGEARDGFQRGDKLTRKDALKHTVDDVFNRLEKTILRMTANTILDVEYDPEYGFPTRINFDRPDMEDLQSRLVVSNFRDRSR